jgi:hypothetical protein
MPATSEQAIARKRERYNARRKAQYQDDADKRRKQNRDSYAHVKATRPEDHKTSRERLRDRKREAQDNKPFVGCDGEGITRGKEHRYTVFRMGGYQLGPFANNALTTPQLLSFITAYPHRDHILVGFFFSYDASMILKNVSWEKQGNYPSPIERLFETDQAESHYQKRRYWTWLSFPGYGSFGVKYIQGHYLRVCRATFDASKKRYQSVKSTIRTIYESFGFFQSSFVNALKSWNIGARYIETIEKMKGKREVFSKTTKAIIDYNKRECELLAEMMKEFRKVCLQSGIRPRFWSGAGKLAEAMHDKHQTLTKEQVEVITPQGLLIDANKAYYGGHFEVSGIGAFKDVYMYDLKSAFPSAMLHMPCLIHGKWKRTSGADLQPLLDTDALFLCGATYSHPIESERINGCLQVEGGFNGLPFRSKKGALSWPALGRGTYWSPELRSARLLDASIKCHEGWRYEKTCECRPFAWVEDYYKARQREENINKSRGIPLKLGINALYGKLAQRVGNPKYQNPIWAGLITAMTRAKINQAIALAGAQNVVMVATDAIFALKPVKLDIGDALGQWGHKGEDDYYPSLFIVKPGLYWPPVSQKRRIKSRGVSTRYIEKHLGDFERAFAEFMPEQGTRWTMPHVRVNIRTFVGLRLAWRRGDRAIACTWADKKGKDAPKISFDYFNKRSGHQPTQDGQALMLGRPVGSHATISHHYTMNGLPLDEDEKDGLEMPEILFEAMPDPPD